MDDLDLDDTCAICNRTPEPDHGEDGKFTTDRTSLVECIRCGQLICCECRDGELCRSCLEWVFSE